MKKLLYVMSVTAFMMVMPGTVQASDNFETVEAIESTEQDNLKIQNGIYKYAVCRTGIYATPNEESYIFDYSLINTTFEVIEEKEGWSTITTEDGVAFIQTKYLSSTPVSTYTEEDLNILAHVICGEAQGYSDDEQLYVGSVVLNRVADPRFPNTIREVVFQLGQYACTRDGNYYRDPTVRNWNNAKWLLENGSSLPKNVVWQSGRRQGRGVYLKTKSHYYCY